MPIELKKETQERVLKSIKQYFLERMEEDIGDLKATLFLDFVLREIGPSIYNQAILDAQAYMQDRVADLDGTCFQPEFQYWKR